MKDATCANCNQVHGLSGYIAITCGNYRRREAPASSASESGDAERVAREIVRDAMLSAEIPAKSVQSYALLVNAIAAALRARPDSPSNGVADAVSAETTADDAHCACCALKIGSW